MSASGYNKAQLLREIQAAKQEAQTLHADATLLEEIGALEQRVKKIKKTNLKYAFQTDYSQLQDIRSKIDFIEAQNRLRAIHRFNLSGIVWTLVFVAFYIFAGYSHRWIE